MGNPVGTSVEVYVDPQHGPMEVWNYADDVATNDVMGSQSMKAMMDWARSTQLQGSMHRHHHRERRGTLWERDMFIAPNNVYGQMDLARHAAETDDVVSNAVNTSEALAFSEVRFWADDEDEQDVWNQVAADVDLDSRLREIWRELFVVSQVYVAVWWHTKTYKVRGKGEGGRAKRKEYTVRCPEAITLLDPFKVVPIGNMMFNQDRLGYIADRLEVDQFDRALENPMTDPVVGRLLLGKYDPPPAERQYLASLGVDITRLYEMNPETVFRHTLTRPQFQKFAPVRMKSVFELLDMKSQLKQMDRAHLIGGTNFIVLITKGSDQRPADNAEIKNLQTMVRTVGQLPVLVGDHRLDVKIVTPKLDSTLKPERYNVLDGRITANLFQMFVLGNYHAGASGDTSGDFVKVIAKGMESRRHMLRRSFEKFIIKPMFDQNLELNAPPKLVFSPKQIALNFDPNWASFLLDLREANEISRQTILSQFDIDQDDEAMLRQREMDNGYDDIFQTQVPYGTPNPLANPNGEPAPIPVTVTPATPAKAPGATKKAQSPRQARRSGGRSGGAAPGSGQGKAPRRPRNKSDRGKGPTTVPASEDTGDDDVEAQEEGEFDDGE